MTDPIGFFNYAESYRRAAKALTVSRDLWTHKESPQRFLNLHAIELFLKSYIYKTSGKSEVDALNEMKSIGHNIPKLYRKARSLGLPRLPATQHMIENFDLCGLFEARYISTGFKTEFETNFISYVSAELCLEIHRSFLDIVPNIGTHLSIDKIFEDETFNISQLL